MVDFFYSMFFLEWISFWVVIFFGGVDFFDREEEKEEGEGR